jgi:LPXTG-site transpeptidase (sortase) family protein
MNVLRSTADLGRTAAEIGGRRRRRAQPSAGGHELALLRQRERLSKPPKGDVNLNRGAGRIEGTARIGEAGNVGIAAHRDGFFRALKDVRVGDTLLLERVTATRTYRVVSTTLVDPSEVSVLAPTTTESVTLVTCYPFYYVGSAPRRFIVRAQRVTPDDKEAPADSTPAGATSRVATRGGSV